MARYLTARLAQKLRTGSFSQILRCVIEDPELSLEIRTSSVAMVYYRKSKILSLHPRIENPKLLSKGYWRNEEIPSIDISNPKQYFVLAKQHVQNFTSKKKNIEFSIQQKISADNNSNKNSFLIVDMEYQFAQNIIKDRTKKKTRFDLVAIHLPTNRIILFELKQGISSSEGKSGIVDHKYKFLEHVNHSQFKSMLISDIKSIIEQKEFLGIYNFETKPILNKLDNAEIDFKVVYAYKNDKELAYYQKKYRADNETIFINTTESNYTLSQ